MVGAKAPNAKKPKPDATGWKKWCDDNPDKKLQLVDFSTNMIGLCTIPYNHLFVLDVDDVEIFQKVVSYFNLELPETTIVQTGKGYHYYYLYPMDNIKYTDRSKLYLGFDIRASTYVVAPGSYHPNGSYYKLIKVVNRLTDTPEWLKSVASNSGEINYILCMLNSFRRREVAIANQQQQSIPEFDLDKLVVQFLEQYPDYEPFLLQFPSYKKSLEITMPRNNISYNPFEINSIGTPLQKPVSDIPLNTQNLLQQSPPVKHRSEPIMSAITALINSGFSNEQVKQIMVSSPLGEKLIQKGSQFTDREIASALAFVQASPPKKQKLNIEHEAYTVMLQQTYVRDVEGKLYCKVIQSNTRIEYIDEKSDSFYGIICKLLLAKVNKSIVPTRFKPLLTILIEEKRLTTPIVPTMNRFHQDDSKLIYDLGRDDYQCIEITPNKVVQIPHRI